MPWPGEKMEYGIELVLINTTRNTVSPNIKMTFSIVLLVAAATAVPGRVDLFVPTPRFPCFRQPAIAAIAVAGQLVIL